MTITWHGPNAPALLPSAVMISLFPKSRRAILAPIDVAEDPADGQRLIVQHNIEERAVN
jgi:hypothetical protein